MKSGNMAGASLSSWRYPTVSCLALYISILTASNLFAPCDGRSVKPLHISFSQQRRPTFDLDYIDPSSDPNNPLNYMDENGYQLTPPSSAPVILPQPPSLRPEGSPVSTPPSASPSSQPPAIMPPGYEPSSGEPHNNGPIGPDFAVWCVARPTVPEQRLQLAMDYACGFGADCKAVRRGGSCFVPTSVISHASYAFNSYWQKTKYVGGTCDFGGTGMLITTDPSVNGCRFVFT